MSVGVMKEYKLKLRKLFIEVFYESIKRKIKTKFICGCRCYERLQPNTKEFTRLAYTELVLELEHLKIKAPERL
jgi:hypothetical protein